MADALPALGIVAAVLGIVLTMGKMKEPPEVLGQSIGAAMVGTFLGVLLSYGFVGPIGRNLEHGAGEKMNYLNVLKVALISFLGGSAPKVAVEFGRRVIPENVQPSFAEIEEALRQKKVIMEDRSKIIIRKVNKKSHGGHHGGSWKVAYADFVTAMMAFFLLLWLLSMTSPAKKVALSEYFNSFSLFSE